MKIICIVICILIALEAAYQAVEAFVCCNAILGVVCGAWSILFIAAATCIFSNNNDDLDL